MGSNITNLSIFKFIDDIKPAHLHIFKNSMCITARTWKHPRCPSADEWIRKLWYIYTMEYCSAIKKNQF